jgi:hypothetical protein
MSRAKPGDTVRHIDRFDGRRIWYAGLFFVVTLVDQTGVWVSTIGDLTMHLPHGSYKVVLAQGR